MPKLIIAEKPSVARDLAHVLGVSNKRDGYIENEQWLITWCIGHLAVLCEPHEYDGSWKRWSFRTLPMIPQEFRLRPNDKTRKQFMVIKKLLHRRDISSVVNACDAGREGELIFRYVYELAEASKPIERLWISSMTDEAIKEGFRHLQPGAQYERLWQAARGRSEADWLVGLNATRALTLRTRQTMQEAQRQSQGNQDSQDAPLMSVGRVQTPTLAMVVQREIEILRFVPQDYWQLFATFGAEHGTYRGKWFRESKEEQGRIDRFWQEAEAQDMFARLEGQPAQVQKVERQTVRERPLLLFDLSSLQRTANRRYGFSAAKTLEIAQSLYESHKLLTYPRTDSNHLSTDMIGEMPGIIQAVSVDPYTPFTRYLQGLLALPTPSRIFNNSKVSDHHAIIPTSKTPNLSRLSREEERIYDLVVRRFLAAFYPDAVIEKTTVITAIDTETFLSRGKVIVERAWREVIGLSDEPASSSRRKKDKDAEESEGSGKEDEDDQGFLPILQEKEHVSVDHLEVQQKQTKPPPRYNEASLLAAMEGAGKQLDEDELKQALKDSGLGTPATRASIIETLLSREYMQRNKKTLHPTPKGMQLIASIPVDDLKSAELTGRWEAQLSRIARGEQDAPSFHREVREYVVHLIENLKQAPLPDMQALLLQPAKIEEHTDETEDTELPPDQQQRRTSRGAPSTKKPGKTTRSSSSSSGRTRQTKSKTSKTSEESSSQSRGAKATHSSASVSRTKAPSATPSSSVSAAPQRTVSGVSESSGDKAPIGVCPTCKQGQMIWGRQAWGCSRWREGCATTIPYEIAGRKLSVDEAKSLIEHGSLGPLVGFRNDQNQLMRGTLRLYQSPGRNSVLIE